MFYLLKSVCERALKEKESSREFKGELKGGGVTSTLSEAVIHCVHRREKQPLGCFDSRTLYLLKIKLGRLSIPE